MAGARSSASKPRTLGDGFSRISGARWRRYSEKGLKKKRGLQRVINTMVCAQNSNRRRIIW